MEQLNAIIQLLAYGDYQGQTDNPSLRIFDWTRNFSGLEIQNGSSDKVLIPPGESKTLFNGEVTHGLTGSSILKLELVSGANGRYRLSVTSGPSGFRTARSITGVVDCDVMVNNNAVAVFDFGAADLTSVQVGDTMRIKGSSIYDASPYAFSSANSGLWKVLSVAGSVVSCVRFADQDFSGIAESATAVSGDVQFYSSAGVQASDKLNIQGTFSSSSYRTYQILDVTPDSIDFVSTLAVAEEENVTYVPDTIVLYSNAKKLFYLETDQDITVRLNGDSSDSNVVNPIEPSKPCAVGVFLKWGDTFKCEIVNKSVNSAEIKWIAGE